MVLEVIIDPRKATGKPWEMFIIGVIYTFISVGLAYTVFQEQASLVMIAFTSIVSVPFMYGSIVESHRREKKEMYASMWSKHAKIITALSFLFFGFVAAHLTLYLVLPQDIVQHVFSVQISTLSQVQQITTGNFTNTTGSFGLILFNNIKVLTLCLIFAFFYGAGAVFILSWNAAVMGAVIGDTIRRGLELGGGSFAVVSGSIAGYFVHGIPEMLAYFVAGLAGGIISVSIVRDNIKSATFKRTTLDALGMLGFAMIMLTFAGLIEVFVSPILL